MKWLGRRSSGNVQDNRGMGGMALGGVGTIVLVVLGLLFGGNPLQYLDLEQGSNTEEATTPLKDQQAHFVSVVLANTEDVWNKLFEEKLQKKYKEPVLVLFSRSTQSGCGSATSATGPFYCPSDEKVYIDLTFYDDLHRRFNAPGDFAMAYVVAHEVGHHIQNLLGISDKMRSMQQGLNKTEANALSVKLELQADFLAGVWAHHAHQLDTILESGDIEEALNAANAIGDDRLQQELQGQVVPDAFTHGTSKQRMYWFKKGFDSGDLNEGDTFNSIDL